MWTFIGLIAGWYLLTQLDHTYVQMLYMDEKLAKLFSRWKRSKAAIISINVQN